MGLPLMFSVKVSRADALGKGRGGVTSPLVWMIKVIIGGSRGGLGICRGVGGTNAKNESTKMKVSAAADLCESTSNKWGRQQL
jgi:hypothetical protein